MRDMVAAARDVAGPTWLAAKSEEPDVPGLAETAAAARLPEPANFDKSFPGCCGIGWHQPRPSHARIASRTTERYRSLLGPSCPMGRDG